MGLVALLRGAIGCGGGVVIASGGTTCDLNITGLMIVSCSCCSDSTSLG